MAWLTNEDTWLPPEDSNTTIVTGPNGEDQLLWEALWVERYAMAVLFYETNGPTSWLSDQSVCDWWGAHCNANGQIEKLLLGKS